MARGKHSSASAHRRMTAAEDEVKWLRAALRKEEREHEVTKRVAERAEGLEQLSRSLRMDIELATSDEVRSLTEKLQAETSDRDDCMLALMHIIAPLKPRPVDSHGEITFSESEWVELRELLGSDVFAQWMSDDCAKTRAGRRAMRRIAARPGALKVSRDRARWTLPPSDVLPGTTGSSA